MSTSQRDRFEIRVAGEKLQGFAGFSLRRSFDRVSECAFAVTWDHRSETLRRLFPPLSQQELTVSLASGEELMTGFLVVSAPQLTEEGMTLPLAGYGRPGVLQKGRLEATKEFKGLQFGQIAPQVVSPFELDFELRGEDGPSIASIALEADKQPWEFLAQLAGERDIFLTDNPAGQVLAWRPVEVGSPVVEYEEGQPPLGPVGVTISDDWYSEVVGISGAKRGRGGKSHIEKNPYYKGTPKPLTYETNHVKPADLPRAVKAKLGRILGNAMSWTIQVPGIRDPSGTIFRPNTTLRLKAPNSFVYRSTEFLVRDVEFSDTEGELSSTLTLAMPGAFGAELPEKPPWVA